MTMNTKKNVAMVLLVLSMLLWVMQAERAVCAGAVHDPAGGVHDHGGHHDVPAQAEKEAGGHARGVASGLFCIVAAIMEILSAMGKTF